MCSENEETVQLTVNRCTESLFGEGKDMTKRTQTTDAGNGKGKG